MAQQNINGVMVDVKPGQSVSVDAGGNINIQNSAGQVVQQVKQPGLGRVMAEGAALGVGAGVGLGIGQGIVDGISDLFGGD